MTLTRPKNAYICPLNLFLETHHNLWIRQNSVKQCDVALFILTNMSEYYVLAKFERLHRSNTVG